MKSRIHRKVSILVQALPEYGLQGSEAWKRRNRFKVEKG